MTHPAARKPINTTAVPIIELDRSARRDLEILQQLDAPFPIYERIALRVGLAPMGGGSTGWLIPHVARSSVRATTSTDVRFALIRVRSILRYQPRHGHPFQDHLTMPSILTHTPRHLRAI